MFYSSNLKDLRDFYIQAWKKQGKVQELTDLEKRICDVIAKHPEYQSYISTNYLEKNFDNTNPFLHMSLHLALQEQIQTNRPQGIQAVYLKLIEKHGDKHQVEHAMMEVLEYILWEAQRINQMPDETVYLNACKKLAEF